MLNVRVAAGTLAGILLFVLAIIAKPAWALTFTLNWQVVAGPAGGKSPAAGLTLEVAADKGFAEVIYTGPADRSGVQTIDVPHEGVYHWRFLRPARPGDSAERSSHMSGTFAAFESTGVAGASPARLTWQPAEGADRYKLVVAAAGQKVRELTTMDLSYVVSREVEPSTIEVIPYWKQSRASRAFHYDPSLVLENAYRVQPPAVVALPSPAATDADAAGPLSPALPEAAPVAGQDTAPAETAEETLATTSPETPAETPAASGPETSAPTYIPGARRLHHVQVAAGYGQESLRSQKLETDIRGDAAAAFLGGGFWTNPAGGIVFDVRGDYHEFRATPRDAVAPELDGAFQTFQRSRYVLGLNGGFDFLRLFQAEDAAPGRHQLSLEFASALVQMPLLAVEIDDALQSPAFPWKSGRLTFAGVGASYSLFWQGGAFTIFGRSLRNAAREEHTQSSVMHWFGLQGESYIGPNLSVSLSAQTRLMSITRCASTAGTCLAQGKVRTLSHETFVMLGLGAVRF